MYSENDGTDFATTTSIAFLQRYTTDLMTILRDGKVGIGTTSPATKLEVAGNITLPSDGQIKFSRNNS